MKPFFSVVIPAYNREKFINRCIDSILNQSFRDWEAIIVDDGSTDNTRGVVQEYNEERIRYFYKTNGGASSARNIGIEKSSGKYIAFLDSDDEYNPDHLQSIYHILSAKGFPVCLVCTDYIKNFSGKIEYKETSAFITTKPNFSNLPYIQTTAIHKDAIGTDRLNEDLVIREDHEFLDRIRFKVPCYRVKNHSVILHRHEDSITSNAIFVKKEMERSIYYFIRTRKKVTIEELSKLYSIYSILSIHYFRKRKSSKMLIYFSKMMFLSPICLFHYPSLKKTLKRIRALFVAK